MDIKHFYMEKGRGDCLMLLHGNGENCGYFQGQIDVFSEQYHVYAIDTRGHGKTPRGDKPFTIRQFSDGGNIAMIFTIQHPDRVDRLILNGANLNAGGVKRSVQIPIEIGYRIAKRFSNKNDSARLNAEMLGLMVNDPNVEPDELESIRAKTLVIAGSRDMIKDSHTRLIARSIPNSQLVVIEGDHFIANKKPEEFNRAVLTFLNG